MLEMRVLVIGDPHGGLDRLRRIPVRDKDVDLILITGDLGRADLARKRFFANIKREKEGLEKLEEGAQFIRAVHTEIHKFTLAILRYLSQFAPVYTIQGNVGIPTKADVEEDKEKHGVILPATRAKLNSMRDVHLVKNQLRVINGKRIGFLEYFTDTNWVRDFKPKEYQKSLRRARKQTDKARRVLRSFGDDLDILIFHQPPYGFLDKVSSRYNPPKKWIGKHAGSKVVLEYIRKSQPRYAFCGHIHEGEGRAKIGRTEVYNLGVCGHKVVEI